MALKVGSSVPPQLQVLTRPAAADVPRQELARIEARIGQLQQKWAMARTPEEKAELARLKSSKAELILGMAPKRDGLRQMPVLDTVRPKTGPVPKAVLDLAQKQLDAGDRGGAYLTLYRELGNEQLAIQAQITTYSGIWGSGALTGNAMAKMAGGPRYNVPLDRFSHDIDQATIDAIKADLAKGGTGRLTDNQFQDADRGVWRSKNMPELFPGNVHFGDFVFGNHDLKDGVAAFFSQGTLNALQLGARNLIPDTTVFGLNDDWRNVASAVGKRPSEFVGDPNYTVMGGKNDRFITVIDNRTGFVEAFFDQKSSVSGIPVPQLTDQPLDKKSKAYETRQWLYKFLGANQHRPDVG